MKRITILFVLAWNSASAQSGCTDIQASNYDPSALINDGSCLYPPTNLALTTLTGLTAPTLDESSGVLFLNGNIWTHVDNTVHSIYRVDSLFPTLLQQVSINSTTNTDWEDLAASNDHLYIGDFGNNSGNRTDLHVLKIAKSDLTPSATNVNAEVIYFTYPDQTSFIPQQNNNSFDCEAFFFYNDSLHLFTKDWVNKITKHYIVPAIAGTHMAVLADSFNVNGLITAAAIQNNGVITLLGYDNTGFAPCFIWMLYDYQGGNFFSGNKRMFNLGSAITAGQVEGIDFVGNNYGYITNERFQQFTFNIPPQLKSFDLSGYLPQISTVVTANTKSKITFTVFPVPSRDEINISIAPFSGNNDFEIVVSDLNGKTVLKESNIENNTKMKIEKLKPGIYKVKIYMDDQFMTALQIVKN